LRVLLDHVPKVAIGIPDWFETFKLNGKCCLDPGHHDKDGQMGHWVGHWKKAISADITLVGCLESKF
jgi:hypothetical protein